MLYPKLNEISYDRELINTFGGYNHKLRIADGEFYDMENLSSDHYPVLSVRQRRGLLRNFDKKITGMIAKDRVYYLKNGNLYAVQADGNDELIAELGLEGDNMRTLVSMGAYMVIYPDMKYVRTIKINNTYEKDDILKEFFFNEWHFEYIDSGIPDSNNRELDIKLCDENGNEVTEYGEIQPDSKNTWRWFDTKNKKLKVYNTSEGVWEEKKLCYMLYDGDYTKDYFKKGDVVAVRGIKCDTRLNVRTTVANSKEESLILEMPYNELLNGMTVFSQYGDITVLRGTQKNVDYIIESQNRLWGCRYGSNVNGDQVNEIYATMLGDFKDWENFEGTSMDSYVVAVGSDGAFTGAITYGGNPIFFKDNCMHLIYGDYPANYQLQTLTCDGVQVGCDKSLVIIDSVLYYKSRRGIFAYDGSLPVLVSEPLGDMSFYEEGVACGIGQKYYISLRDTRTDKRVMFVLDTAKALWHKEDGPAVTQFCTHKGYVYYLSNDNDTQIFTLLGSGTPDAASVKWYAETGIIGVDDPDKKYVSRMDVRMSLEIGAKARFYIQYDSSGEWEYLFTMTGTSLRSFSIPIRPKRCDHFRLKIEGEGDMKLFSLCKNVERGSNV
ncbi:MAG: hypothetical protein IKB51_07435 [Clostridia bacterium]|nr:hypothetical protein [Clostridia bacterium]